MASNQPDIIESVQELEDRLPIAFNDKTLAVRALTHRSYLNETQLVHGDNERLEFLGDAVLDLIVADILYQRFPEQREGSLTAMRAGLVRRETLAEFARQLGLGSFLLLGKGEAESGGRERDVILCAAFEALVGAIYLDQGMEETTEFLNTLLEPTLEPLSAGHFTKNPKSQLQEWSQAELGETPHYVTIASTGPDHAKEFTVEVRIGGKTFGTGMGNSKQQAAKDAARSALSQLMSSGQVTVLPV
ncbi:MAG: ribonuclease III [Caldilineales bacterium]|nr:ribonuclease III [Caldilineales bacterium]